MQCPECKSDRTDVKSTVKVIGDDPKNLRKRKCPICGHNFTTTEKENK